MPRTSEEITEDSHKLKKLMPSYADTQQVFSSAKHAERHGDKKALLKDRRIGAHLIRLEKLLSHDGVEGRVWDSAVKELIIDEQDIPESFWKQQLQIWRDNGHGTITFLTNSEKEQITEQLQDAQRTGLESWRNYLEQTGDQYPLWFKLYAWEGMSGLGVFDQQKQAFRKRAKNTVAPYPQLNPAVLAKVYDTVTTTEKTETFNSLYSRILIEQKASIPTPENPDDVHGEWREYTQNDVEAITQAAQATPWCIAGSHYAETYTKDGGKFLLFHLQDHETGIYSPTACASVRLDRVGYVAELSGLKGGSSQYLEDGLIPTVEEKVKTLPGGENYLQAFEDKQRLIAMDKKFQSGEPFSLEELLFLYEVDRRISFLDTYTDDPRPRQFKRDLEDHLKVLTEFYGSERKARTAIVDLDRLKANPIRFLTPEFDPDVVASRLTLQEKAQIIALLVEAGTSIDPAELFDELSPYEKLNFYQFFKKVDIAVTPNQIAELFTDDEKVGLLNSLRAIGADIDADALVIKKYGEREVFGRGSVDRIAMLLHGGVSPELMLKMLKMGSGEELQANDKNGGVYAIEAVSALRSIIQSVQGSSQDKARFFDQFFKKLDENKETPIGISGMGRYNFKEEFLEGGFDINTIAEKIGINSFNKGELDRFMELGVNKEIIVKALVGKPVLNDGEPNTPGVAHNIKKLLEYGCSIEDITTNMSSTYQFEKFEELRSYGAKLDLDTVVAQMPPKDVIFHIERILEKGAKVNIDAVLRRAKVGDVYEYMVEALVAVGADPVLIADKINIEQFFIGTEIYTSSDYHYMVKRLSEFPKVYERVRERIEQLRSEKSRAQHELWRKDREESAKWGAINKHNVESDNNPSE